MNLKQALMRENAMVAPAVRPAAVAGLFYPGDEAELAMTIASLMREGASAPPLTPKALIVPHAGYIYSGPIAASAYRLLVPMHQQIKRVVLLGPAHRMPVRGLALPGCASFATPLGLVKVDAAACEKALRLPQVELVPAAHTTEHSIEVQLPFLQMLLNDFRVVPLLVGDATPAEVAEVLDVLWGGNETLIVVSSDLSHYLPYERAHAVDNAICQRILAMDERIRYEDACGATAICGLLAAARVYGLSPTLLDLRNSGDTAGDKARVVGYAAIAFSDASHEDDTLGDALLLLARTAIEHKLGLAAAVVRASMPACRLPGASFVTLTCDGMLRGCIGSLTAERPLDEDVEANALAAAFRDPRFPPIQSQEWPRVRVEVSLLSPSEPMHFKDEADALHQLRPYEDGVILEYGAHRATFLPQVWEQLPNPANFLGQLKLKAGLPANYWSPELRLSRYSVRKWEEKHGEG